MKDADFSLTPDLLLNAYASGIFPMSEGRDDPEIFWVDPRRRGIIPMDGLRISRSLAKRMRRGGYEVSLNADFAGVVDGCADRPETWINGEIRSQYIALHQMGHAHSLEITVSGRMIGGIYGVSLGAAFFGESMFSSANDGSKLALVHLVDHLRRCGYRLFDTQFLTDHLASLGGIEISRGAYRSQLAIALQYPAGIDAVPLDPSPHSVLQRNAQTSNRG
ncbi:leucyl/phenylalanyl-tRNA--protein transferase [Roseovarius nanhaiticus]|uniref:Leucyl/phenylalanyl-tRNA--protein transferase n=1 Tax=Roseovarius nanhaiticus TaxID=573024 RepID=A0A1N7FP18_9RHOB|nr:leucyl/phenylalanyl-tRNA--protein transferase [Roseovarius nanhaiticus]SEK49545.1 leucyl/phenylalanyl-tRNA--protein transferase [Roseovarius nanhaiticus]SIS02037.1 leucyl/phenylalanyl-tRNA--protein transferase [Roseovarius nanhaiticus]